MSNRTDQGPISASAIMVLKGTRHGWWEFTIAPSAQHRLDEGKSGSYEKHRPVCTIACFITRSKNRRCLGLSSRWVERIRYDRDYFPNDRRWTAEVFDRREVFWTRPSRSNKWSLRGHGLGGRWKASRARDSPAWSWSTRDDQSSTRIRQTAAGDQIKYYEEPRADPELARRSSCVRIERSDLPTIDHPSAFFGKPWVSFYPNFQYNNVYAITKHHRFYGGGWEWQGNPNPTFSF